ncbi:hypothetical protein Sya03_24600 [Spirilliplanes yamanashiensis]|uniref:Uncharacterized protein n=1 Tax=Spirilliplanes yamanashiensis TaxID=42233 RepID=A0A8J3Y794_9ACTN|nr:hypothetical protein Sya03_24600 [Spirilliplanes yamanashiensis]
MYGVRRMPSLSVQTHVTTNDDTMSAISHSSDPTQGAAESGTGTAATSCRAAEPGKSSHSSVRPLQATR